MPNGAVFCMSKYFIANALALNPGKINVIKFIPSNSPQYLINIEYNDEYIKESKDTKFFGLQIDNHWHWINYIDQLVFKSSGVSYAVTSMLHASNTNPLKSIYFASLMKYGIFSGVTHVTEKKICKLQKKIFKNMVGVQHRNSCSGLFKRLKILHLPFEYVF